MGKTFLTFAHVGDSRIVLKTSNGFLRMTQDHKGTNVKE